MGMPTPKRIETFVTDALSNIVVVSESSSALVRYRAGTMAARKLAQARELLDIYLEGELPYANEEWVDISNE